MILRAFVYCGDIMTNIIDLESYIDDYLDGKIFKYDFIYYTNMLYPDMPINDVILAYFNHAIHHKNNESLEKAMLITDFFDDKIYLPIYERLFLEDWHTWHVDIIAALENYNSLSSINILIKGFDLRLDYMDYNHYYSFQRKLMWAIYKLNPNHAYELLSDIKSKITPELHPTFQQFLGDIRKGKK